MKLSQEDLDRIRDSGRRPGEVLRMLRVLRRPRPTVLLDRACSIGDGVTRLDGGALESCVEAGVRAMDRVGFFLPASGAATRLFAPRPLSEEAETHLRALFAGLPTDPRLLPKVLLPFHIDSRGRHTALDVHLREARATVGPQVDLRLHLTVAPEHQGDILRAFEEARRHHPGRLMLSLSVQDPATDGVCVDDDGFTVFAADGLPRFRPGGHGALLDNLEALGGDIVLVRNADNAAPVRLQEERARWQRALVGHLVALEAAVQQCWNDAEAARALLSEIFGVALPPDATEEEILDALHRPIRVAGVVRASAHVGGAPFWVTAPEGRVRPQLVDAPQVAANPDQQAIWRTATHVNPVELALSMRRPDGRPHALEALADPRFPLVVDKEVDGFQRTCFEHPGLWNASMAGWNTVFLELPTATFCPVKHVSDLAGPLHRS